MLTRCNELARKAIKHYGIFLDSYQQAAGSAALGLETLCVRCLHVACASWGGVVSQKTEISRAVPPEPLPDCRLVGVLVLKDGKTAEKVEKDHTSTCPPYVVPTLKLKS